MTLLVQAKPDSSHLRYIHVWHAAKSYWSAKRLGRSFWTFFGAAFLFDLGLSLYFFLFNLYLVQHRFTERYLGFIGAAMTLGNVLGAIPVGMLARRQGLRPLLLACLFAVPALSVLRAFFFWMPAQIGLAFVTGIALSNWTVCFSPAVASLTTNENRPFAFSVIFATGIGSGSLAGLAGGYFPEWLRHGGAPAHAADGMRLVLLLACGITVLAVLPMMMLHFQVEEDGQRNRRLFTPFLLRFLTAMALWNVATGFFTPFSSVYFSRHLHIPLARVGVIFSLSQLVQVFAVLMAPALFRKFGRLTGIVCTQIGAAIALYMLSQARSLSMAVVIYLAFTGLQWMSGPGIYSLLMDRTPKEQRSNASAMQNVVTASSQAAASATAGTMFERYGYPASLAGDAGVAAVAAVLLYVLLASKDNAASSSVASCCP